jgi:hypothetical protein
MNRKLAILPLILVAAGLVLALLIFVGLDTSAGDRPPVSPPDAHASPEVAYAELEAGSVSIVESTGAARAELPPTLREAMRADTTQNEAAREVLLEAIDDATVTYDVQGLVTLGPMLSHPDPEIREAAIEGIVQLGETAGAQVLREAAGKSRNPREVEQMIEAAAFLEIPEYRPGFFESR